MATALLAIVLLSMATLTLAACHTTEGAGRDLEAAGRGIAETAEEARDYE